MGNVLSTEKQQQVQALGRLGWSLRRIQEATGVRRETASAYLKSAGISVRGSGRWGHDPPKPAIEVITGSEAKPGIEVITGTEANPAREVITGSPPKPASDRPRRAPARYTARRSKPTWGAVATRWP